MDGQTILHKLKLHLLEGNPEYRFVTQNREHQCLHFRSPSDYSAPGPPTS
jgi:hypothetical protein